VRHIDRGDTGLAASTL